MGQRLRTAAVVAGLSAALLAGCGDAHEPPATDGPTVLDPTSPPGEDPTGSADPTPSEEPTASGGATDVPENVQAATEDLADRLGIPPTDIQAGPLEPVTWPDGSLGCPAPGRSYPQVLTDGFRLVLTVGGQEYAYHSGEDGDLVYCESPTEPVTPSTQTS